MMLHGAVVPQTRRMIDSQELDENETHVFIHHPWTHINVYVFWITIYRMCMLKWVTLKWVFRVCTYLSLNIYARNSMRNTLEQTELIYWRAWLKWGRGVCEPKVSIAIFGFLPICNQILFINCVSKDLISQKRKISRTVCVYYDVRCMRLEYRIKISKQNMQIGWAHTHPPTTHLWGGGNFFASLI